MDLPPEETGEVRNFRMPLLQNALLPRSTNKHARTGDACDRCGRTVLTGEDVFVCRGDRIVCELCIGLEPEAPLDKRVVHGAELGNTIRVVDKRSRHAATPVARSDSPRRRRRARIPTPPKPSE